VDSTFSELRPKSFDERFLEPRRPRISEGWNELEPSYRADFFEKQQCVRLMPEWLRTRRCSNVEIDAVVSDSEPESSDSILRIESLVASAIRNADE
jgi:hypothetical protein